MKYIAIIFLIYIFLKSVYYGMFELKEKNNKSGGVAIIFFATLGLIISLLIIFIFY